MMTSMNHQGDAKFFAEFGFSAYFPKPTTTSDLFAALSVVSEGGEALQQAKPLVTHHYLNSLNYKDEGDKLLNNKFLNKQGAWPESTHILLVEDNQINQMVATGILNDFGLQTDCANNGLEALDSLRQAPDDKPYTLGLMDCQMPMMDGYEASRKIRGGNAGERNKAIPIVAMTANAMTGDRDKCMEAGMSDYLVKPIDHDALLEKLQLWILTEEHNESLSTTKSSLNQTCRCEIKMPRLNVFWVSTLC